jgi:casein kinase I family protein HRR25
MFVIWVRQVLLNIFSHAQLSVIESLHARHYIHRDVKPSNFMVRFDNAAPTIFLIDFGLARLFRNPATYLHTPFTTKHSVVGTLPFTSVNGQQGHAQSRRDDLESLAYTIIYLVHGHLPWTTIFVRRDHEAVLREKMVITAEELCEGLPPPFLKFVVCVRSLGFDEKPDYHRLHTILLQCSETETDHPTRAAPSSALPSLSVSHTPVSSDRV